MDEDSVVDFCVYDGEGEVCHEPPSCCSGGRLPMIWKRGSSLRRTFDLGSEFRPEALSKGFVVRGLDEQFAPRLLCEACLLHGAIRRASSNTSSAAKVSTSPRS